MADSMSTPRPCPPFDDESATAAVAAMEAAVLSHDPAVVGELFAPDISVRDQHEFIRGRKS